VFAPLPPRASAVDACAEALRRRILAGELAVGARLPSERELAVSLGTSRVTLRSALARLAEARLLAVRHGAGYVVRDFQLDGGPDLLPGLVELARARDAALLAADLLLVRRQLAAAVLERLADGVPRAAQARIAAAVDALEQRARAHANAAVLTDADSAALAEADVAVVAALLAATSSPVLQLCLNPIVGVLRNMPALRRAMYAHPERNVAGWRALLAWLHRPDRRAIPLVAAELAERDRDTLARLRQGPRNRNRNRTRKSK
jgi:DNA-binding FadR family transcriptional regulator